MNITKANLKMEDEQPTKKQRMTEIENEIDDKNFYDNIIAENKDAIMTASIFANIIISSKFEINFSDDGFVTCFRRLENNIDFNKSNMDSFVFNEACLTNHIVLANYYAKKFPDKFVFQLDAQKKHITNYYINETNANFADCSICQETNKANIKLEVCNHAFCEKCIVEWGQKMGRCNDDAVTCPFCRRESKNLLSV